MLRKIEHTAFVRRSYGDIAWLLDRHGDEILEHVALAAVERSVAIHDAAENPLPGFDGSQPIELSAGPLVLSDNRATLQFTWEGNATKRLLVNADIRLEAVLFGRRLVKAALRELLDVLVRRLEDFEESPISR